MKKVEQTIWVVILLLLFCKYHNTYFIGMEVLTLVALGASALCYAMFSPFYFTASDEKQEKLRPDLTMPPRLQYNFTYYFGLIFSIEILNILFKIYFWPGHSIIGLIGILGNILGLVLLFYLEKDTEAYYYKNIIKRSLFIGFFSFIFYYVTIDQLIDLQWRNYPKYAAAKKEYIKDRKNKALKIKADKIYQQEYQEKHQSLE